MFVEWLVEEAYYIRTFLQLSHIPHYYHSSEICRGNGTLLERIISSFILLLTNIGKIFTGRDSTGFKKDNSMHASQYYYTERTGLRRKCAKLSIGGDVLLLLLQQIICTVKIRRAPTRHENTYRFQANYNKDVNISFLPLSVYSYSG